MGQKARRTGESLPYYVLTECWEEVPPGLTGGWEHGLTEGWEHGLTEDWEHVPPGFTEHVSLGLTKAK